MTLDTTPQPPSMKEIIGKLDLIKINFCSVKETIKRIRRQTTDWRKILAKNIR